MGYALVSWNGKDPEEAKERGHFPGLTPLYPEKQMVRNHTWSHRFSYVGFNFARLVLGAPAIVARQKQGR